MKMRPKSRVAALPLSEYPPSTIFGLSPNKAAAIALQDIRAWFRDSRPPSVSKGPDDDEPSPVSYEAPVRVSADGDDDAALVADVVALSCSGRAREAMAKLVDVIERELRRSETRPHVDALLRLLDPNALAPAVTIAVLTITWYAKEQLEAREEFLSRAERALDALLGSERAQALLASRR